MGSHTGRVWAAGFVAGIFLSSGFVANAAQPMGSWSQLPSYQTNWWYQPPSYKKPKQPNIILVTLDDVGQDVVSLYTAPYEDPDLFAGSVIPPTPTIESLADDGMVFRNVMAMPACTATRGTWITGKLPSNTGIAAPLLPQTTPRDTPTQLDLTDPDLLPKLLKDRGYATAFVGKWHLTGPELPPGTPLTLPALLAADVPLRDDPRKAGFDYWAGTLYGAPIPSYYNWLQDINGVRTVTGPPPGPGLPPLFQTAFTVTENIDQAVDWINDQTEPYFIHLSLSAPHFLYELPPKELVDPTVVAQVEEAFGKRIPGYSYPVVTNAITTPDLETLAEQRAVFNALISALDTELGRFVDEGNINFDETVMMIMGDNGTQGDFILGQVGFGAIEAVVPPFDTSRSKGTLYRNGVEVPLVVIGPRVKAGKHSDALVNSADVYATILDFAGVRPPSDVQAVSFKPVLKTGWDGFRQVNAAEFHLATPEVSGRQLQALSQAGRVVANKEYRLLAKLDVQNNQVVCIPNVPGEISYSPDCTMAPPVPGVPGVVNGQKQYVLELYNIRKDPMEMNNLLDDPIAMHPGDFMNFLQLCNEANALSESANYYFTNQMCDPWAAYR